MKNQISNEELIASKQEKLLHGVSLYNRISQETNPGDVNIIFKVSGPPFLILTARDGSEVVIDGEVASEIVRLLMENPPKHCIPKRHTWIETIGHPGFKGPNRGGDRW